jgi:non-specific serine/threonine protein kinase
VIVVHAFWHPAGLQLWGEATDRYGLAAPARRGRAPKRSAAREHPFAAEVRALTEAAARLGAPASHLASGEFTLHLPSHPRAPQPSPDLLHAHAAEPPGEPSAVAPWIVATFGIPYIDAIGFLLGLPPDPVDGAAAAGTLRWWAEAAKLALELVARGRVVPVIEPDRSARWRPVLSDDADAERMAVLRRAFPGACAAAEIRTAGGEPDDAALAALSALVDGCVRQGLAGSAVIPPREGRSVGEHWLKALTGESRAISAEAGELDRLGDALAKWRRPLTPSADGGLRTCFRLTAPGDAAEGGAATGGGDEDAWKLDFLLQATDDPSLLVPADQVWRTRGALKVLRHTVDDPQERLLGDLGRARRLFPALEPALRGRRPSGCELDADGAYTFLREGAPLLAQAGFGVRVPSWWGRPAARLGLKLRAKSPSAKSEAEGRFGLETLVAYDWQVSLGGEALSAGEFRALARMKVPLVRFRGQWVELKPDEVQAALRMFERGGADGQMTAAEALRLAMGAQDTEDDLPVVAVEASGWLAELLAAGDESTLEPVPPPAGFAGSLRPYQERGLAWLAFLDRLGLGGCLADDMGLGKTVQLLALLLAARPGGRRKRPPPTLLVCPMSLVGNWQREAARFAPELRVHVHHGGERLSGAALRKAVRGSDLVITTYALAARDRDELAEVEWGRVVLDEAQNIKNSAAKQAQAVRGFQAPRRVALTGTPVENRLAELWSILEFLNPGLLGSAADFRNRFATPIERYRDAARAAELQRITRPFILRRLKTDRSIIQDLPEKQEMKVFCNLTREQASLYQATVDEMMERVEKAEEGIERRGLVLSTLLKLKQVCNHPAQLLQDHSALAGRSGKLARLEELAEEIVAVGDRALVFTQFAEMGHLLQRRLEERLGREVPFLHGGTQRAAREAMVARFQGEGGPPLLLLSLKAGGTGLNLTAANHVIHYDRWWNPAVEDQATDRAFRIGQRRNVQVRKLMCAGTLEERIDEVIEEKKALAGSVLGTGEAWLTELSTAELRRVIALSSDAVAE